MSGSTFVDSHCHLDRFTAIDRAGLIARARGVGVSDILTVSTRLGTREHLLEIARAESIGVKIWCTVGTHPDYVNDDPLVEGEAIAAMTEAPEIVGIGESGLDFVDEGSDRSRQAACFQAHIKAARLTGLPLVVHSREADECMVAMLRQEYGKGPFRFVMHCFSSGPALAATTIECGGYVSFSGILTFSKASSLRELAATLPIERILVETDAPYLAPVPHRGRQNEPAFVVDTARVLADVLRCSEREVAEQTTSNFRSLFLKAV